MNENKNTLDTKSNTEGKVPENFNKQIEDYELSLEIKDATISALRDTLDTYTDIEKQSLKNNAEYITSLNQVTVQLFWAENDMTFSEKNSFSQTNQLSDSVVHFNFCITENIKNIKFFRFDIGNTIGFLNIHEIEIKNKKGEIIWSWDKRSVLYEHGLLFISSNLNWPGKVIELSISNDPHFIIANDILEAYSSEDLIFNIELSAIEPSQYHVLSTSLTAPLLFNMDKEALYFQEFAELLKSRNRFISNELTLADKLIETLNAKTIDLNKSIALNENTIKHLGVNIQTLESNNNQLIKGIALLENEIVAKNELINKLNAENEKTENKFLETVNTYYNLQKELVEKNITLTWLTEAKNKLEQTIKNNNIHFNTALEDKNKKELEISILNNHITDITTQNGSLINIIKEQQKKLEHLNTEYMATTTQKLTIEGMLNKITADYSTLDISNKQLNIELKRYVDHYDKKNILQIAFNRIFRKT